MSTYGPEEDPNDYNYWPSEDFQRQREESGHNDIIWGIVIVLVAGGITLGTYVAAAPGGIFFISYGGILWGAYKILTGWVKASGTWRVIGILVAGAMVATGIMAYQRVTDQGDNNNAVEVGDCVDEYGIEASCSEADGLYVVLRIERYPSEMSFPGEARFHSGSIDCPSQSDWYYSPTRESWDAGDRRLLCVRER